MSNNKKSSNTLNERIKNLRKEKGLTQLDLAEKLNITDKAVSKWESGDGNPDITLLPKLAEIFGTTIDYLLTGNEASSKVLYMSKIENCAKSDDPTILEDFNISSAKIRDENGKSLLDYVFAYDSFKVYSKLLSCCRNNADYISLVPYLTGQIFVWLIRNQVEQKVLLAINSDNEIKYLSFFNNLSGYGRADEKSNSSISLGYEMVFRYLVEHYNDLSDVQKNYYFDLTGKGIFKNDDCWTRAYPYFLDYAYDLNKELFNLLLKRIDSSDDKKAIEEYKKNNISYLKDYCYIFVALESTYIKALKDNNMDLATKINYYLKKPHDEYEISKILLDLNDKISEKDKIFKTVLRNHLLQLDILFKLNNTSIIKEYILKYPLTARELVTKNLKKENYKEVFEFFVDSGMDQAANALMRRDFRELNHLLRDYPIASAVANVEKNNGCYLQISEKEMEEKNKALAMSMYNSTRFIDPNADYIDALVFGYPHKQDVLKLCTRTSDDDYNALIDAIKEHILKNVDKKD